MSISYQIVVERQGGSISCISEPGHGTEFRIIIPIPLGAKVRPVEQAIHTLCEGSQLSRLPAPGGPATNN